MPGRRSSQPTIGTAVLGAALAGVGALLWRGSGYMLYVAAFVAISVIAVLSLALLMGQAGQVSLGQAALVGSGAYMAAQLTAWNVPFPLVIPAAALSTAALGALVGLPSLRIRGLQLAATTLAFGLLCERLLFERPWDPSSTLGVAAPRPAVVSGDRAFLALAIGALVAVGLLDAAVRRSRFGRAFRAVRDREDIAAAQGVPVASVKLGAYTLSGAYAGVAGASFAFLLERVTPAPFTVWASLGLVAAVVVGGLGSFSGAVTAGAVFAGVPELLRPAATLTPLFSALLLTAVPIIRPAGLGWVLDRPLPRLRRSPTVDLRSRESVAASPALEPVRRPVPLAVPVRSLLEVSAIDVAFGGNQVLRGAGFTVRRGESVGLIGPNGAGKTTLFNCVSGFVRPDAGRIMYRGRDLLALPPQARPRLGIGRTFQQVGLSPAATVRDNLLLAQYAVEPYGVAAALTRTPSVRRAERRLAARADAALDLVGATEFAAVPVGDLPHGSQRLVELAAVLASGAELILLDEPAAGMGPDEAARLAELLQQLRRALRITLLVIDHHVPFVSAVCERISVLDGGAVIADGPPEQIRRDPLVAAVYLGEGEGDGNGDEVMAHA